MRIEIYTGDRTQLMPLFRDADDSETAIAEYIARGDILVARDARSIIGYVQMIGDGPKWELKSIAVVEAQRGLNVGRALVRAGVAHARSRGGLRIVVAAAAADTRVLGFYQRLGFRVSGVERDAFTTANGYPANLLIDGIRVRDRVWFALDEKPCW